MIDQLLKRRGIRVYFPRRSKTEGSHTEHKHCDYPVLIAYCVRLDLIIA